MIKFRRYLILLAVTALFVSSCSIAPEYSGTKYKRTEHVDVYYSFNDVKKDYTVIGHLVSRKYSNKVLQRNLVSWAQRVGGDAIILTGMNGSTEKPGAVVLKYKSRSL